MDLRETKAAGEKGSRHPWELARLEVMWDIFKQYSGLKQNTILMDLGCGDTFFIEKFSVKHPGHKYLAVDTAFETDFSERLNRNLNPKGIFLFNNLQAAEASAGGFLDSIFLMDVIEHIENDVEFLSDLRKSPVINEKTVIYITVPAYEKLFCSHDKFLGHYRRYTNRMLREHVSRAGFVPISYGYFFTSLLIPRFFRVMKEKAFGAGNSTTGLVEWKGGKAVSGVLKFFLYWDYLVSKFFRLAGIRLPGLSNYIVCRIAA